MRRIAAIVLTSLAVAGVVTAPAAADADSVSIACTSSGGPYTGYGFEATVTDAGASYSGPAVLETNADPFGSGSWVATPVSITAGQYSAEVDDYFAGTELDEIGIRLTAGGSTATCVATYDPVLVDLSGSLSITAGDTAAILADALVSDPFVNHDLTAALVVKSGGSWVEVQRARFTDWGHYAILSYRPSYSREAQVLVYAAADVLIGASDSFIINVKNPTPKVVSKPTSIIQGKTATITAAYGSSSTSGKAALQVYSGSSWKTLKSSSFSNGVVSFTRTPSATYKYRVLFTPTGKSAVATSSFTITYLPLFSIKNPGTVRRGDWADFAITNRWDKNGTVKLQYYASGAWKTYRSIATYAKESFDVTVQIKGTYKWRILAGTLASPSLTVKTR